MSVAPYLRRDLTTRDIMVNVCIALAPPCVAALWYFGLNAFFLLAVCVAACVASEFIWQKLFRTGACFTDCSALVTGLLTALCLPAKTPLWAAALASVFAIVIVKQLFGGIGKNFLNPALAARAFLTLAFPTSVLQYTQPHTDAVATATPLTHLNFEGYWSMLSGNEAGSIGETSAVMILLGFWWLAHKGIVRVEMPFLFIGATALVTWIFGGDALFTGDAAGNVLSGGLLLGACFMATDFATTPCTKEGKWIFMLGAGIITALIRIYGAYPEGVCYAILIMNCFAPLIETLTLPRVYGTKRKGIA